MTQGLNVKRLGAYSLSLSKCSMGLGKWLAMHGGCQVSWEVSRDEVRKLDMFLQTAAPI